MTFYSNVSTATTTLDTWLGLSEVIKRAEKGSHQKYTHLRHFLRRARLESRPLKVNSPLVNFITHFHVHVFMRNHMLNSDVFFYRLVHFSKNLGAAYGGSFVSPCKHTQNVKAIAKSSSITCIIYIKWKRIMANAEKKKTFKLIQDIRWNENASVYPKNLKK